MEEVIPANVRPGNQSASDSCLATLCYLIFIYIYIIWYTYPQVSARAPPEVKLAFAATGGCLLSLNLLETNEFCWKEHKTRELSESHCWDGLSAPPASALCHCVHFATLFLYKYLSRFLPFVSIQPNRQCISWRDGLHRLLAKNIRQWDATVILKAFLCLKRIEFIPLSIKTRQLKIQQGLDLFFQIKEKKCSIIHFWGEKYHPRPTSPFKEKKT